VESPEDLKAVAKALAELLRRYELHITEKGYGAHLGRHAAEHKDVAGTLDRIPTGVGGSAPTGASYVTISAEAGLTSERRVAAGTGIGLTDGGANSTLTIAVAVGIADDKILQVDDAAAADNEYAKFTAAGLEGRSYAEVKQDLDLGEYDPIGTGDSEATAHVAAHSALDTGVHGATAGEDIENTGNRNAANGYAGLGDGGMLYSFQLGSGTPSATTFLRGDQTWAVPPSAAATKFVTYIVFGTEDQTYTV
jgi:hypothetical protein